MAAKDATQRRLIASLGGLVAAQTSDPQARGRASVAARKQRCYDATDPSLPESERQRIAALKFKEQMKRASLARSQTKGKAR